LGSRADPATGQSTLEVGTNELQVSPDLDVEQLPALRVRVYRRAGQAKQVVAQGPNDEPDATHLEWEVSRREWRKEHRPKRHARV
jgi:hypothetical protein